jgi:protein-S-isoprenylcysteine O-methyltransferase Ste14
MRERKLNDTSRTWQHKHNNTARQQDGPAPPRRSKLARGEAAALLLAVLFVISLFLSPQITWMVGLAAGLIMLAGAIALGLRLWAPDRISVNRAPPNDEASARPNGDTGARRRLVDMRSRIWLANRR